MASQNEKPKYIDLLCLNEKDCLLISRKTFENLATVKDENIKIISQSGGSTNQLFKVKTESIEGVPRIFLIRIYGQGTEEILDRKHELEILEVLVRFNLGPQVYSTFINGFTYQFFEGRTLMSTELPKFNKLVAVHLAKWHKMNVEISEKRSGLWSYVEKWFDKIPKKQFKQAIVQKKFEELGLSLEKITNEIDFLKTLLNKLQSPLVFCHNDVQSGNIIVDKKDATKIHFIDQEYACYNHRAFDIGNYFCEWCGLDIDVANYPSKEKQEEFLETYFTEFYSKDPTKEELAKFYTEVNQFSMSSDLMWGIWALVQADASVIDFDYILYAKKRFSQYYKKKAEI